MVIRKVLLLMLIGLLIPSINVLGNDVNLTLEKNMEAYRLPNGFGAITFSTQSEVFKQLDASVPSVQWSVDPHQDFTNGKIDVKNDYISEPSIAEWCIHCPTCLSCPSNKKDQTGLVKWNTDIPITGIEDYFSDQGIPSITEKMGVFNEHGSGEKCQVYYRTQVNCDPFPLCGFDIVCTKSCSNNKRFDVMQVYAPEISIPENEVELFGDYLIGTSPTLPTVKYDTATQSFIVY